MHIQPPPGTATEKDVIELEARTNRLCELVDGVLVEKAMGYLESRLAAMLIFYLESYLQQHDLGSVAGADGMLGLAPGLVRIPDVSFIAWDRLPDRRAPEEPIPKIAPDLAVEILSKSNTEAEMARKLREYFGAGTSLVWYVSPPQRQVRVYTALEESRVLTERESLDGGNLLPGFQLSIREWFTRAERARPGKKE